MPESRAIRVLLAEPQPLFRQGAMRELEEAPDIQVVMAVGTANDALAGIHQEVPDVAVITLQLPDASGISILEGVSEGVRTLMLTAEESREAIFEAMMLGARGFLLKWHDVRLTEAVRLVARGEIVMGPAALRLFVTAARERLVGGPRTRGAPLSNREREVISLVSKGLSQPQIANDLGLSLATVRTHSRNAYIKLGVSNQAAAVRAAYRQGLIDDEDA